MKPLKLSKKLNPLGEIMNLPDAFKEIKKMKHDSSFENLGDWLANNNSKPKKMKSFYKIAASLIFATMILIACTVPVQHEEEIGYMIKGMAPFNEANFKNKAGLLLKLEDVNIDPSGVSINPVLHEEIGNAESKKMDEVILVLPDAHRKLAEDKMHALSQVFNFETIDIHPIEEQVERTIFESALHTFDIKVKKNLSDEKITERINIFLHKNSNTKGEAKLKLDASGNRVVVLEVVLEESSNAVNKRSIEGLFNDLSPERPVSERTKNMNEEELKALKLREMKKHKDQRN